MANTYEFIIKKLNKNLNVDSSIFDNAIDSIDWCCKVTNENGIFIEIPGETKLVEPKVNSYISYENLTKSDLVQWIESSINVEDLKKDADAQLLKITTITKIPLREDLI